MERERYPFHKFKMVLFDMIQKLSASYDTKIIPTQTTITNEVWRHSIIYSNENLSFKCVESGRKRKKYYVSSTTFRSKEEREITEKDIEKFEKLDCRNFEDFKAASQSIWIVEATSMNKNKWTDTATSTCPVFYKKNMCKHVLIIGLKMNIIEAPSEADPTVLGNKNRPGRKKKARKALVVQ